MLILTPKLKHFQHLAGWPVTLQLRVLLKGHAGTSALLAVTRQLPAPCHVSGAPGSRAHRSHSLLTANCQEVVNLQCCILILTACLKKCQFGTEGTKQCVRSDHPRDRHSPLKKQQRVTGCIKVVDHPKMLVKPTSPVDLNTFSL